jgi:hypothetical protein
MSRIPPAFIPATSANCWRSIPAAARNSLRLTRDDLRGLVGILDVAEAEIDRMDGMEG